MNTTGRQLVLIAGAVALGAAILGLGFDDPSVGEAPSTPPAPTPVPQDEPTPAPTASAAATAEINVLVANSTGVAGLAGSVATQLTESFGYTALTPVDATGEPVTTTLVFYVPGAEGDAQKVAASLALSAGAVSPMPSSVPVADAAGADVLVLLGLDKVPPG